MEELEMIEVTMSAFCDSIVFKVHYSALYKKGEAWYIMDRANHVLENPAYIDLEMERIAERRKQFRQALDTFFKQSQN